MRIIFALLVFISTQHAQAWGGRGHDAICHVAVFLVKEPGLKEYLQNKQQMMGHLCNMPDFHWKSLGGAINQVGDPTHYIDPEVLGIPVTEIPLEYKKIIDQFTGKPNKFSNSGTIFSVPQEFG